MASFWRAVSCLAWCMAQRQPRQAPWQQPYTSQRQDPVFASYTEMVLPEQHVISIDEGEDTDRAGLVPVTQTALNEARKAENRVKRQVAYVRAATQDCIPETACAISSRSCQVGTRYSGSRSDARTGPCHLMPGGHRHEAGGSRTPGEDGGSCPSFYGQDLWRMGEGRGQRGRWHTEASSCQLSWPSNPSPCDKGGAEDTCSHNAQEDSGCRAGMCSSTRPVPDGGCIAGARTLLCCWTFTCGHSTEYCGAKPGANSQAPGTTRSRAGQGTDYYGTTSCWHQGGYQRCIEDKDGSAKSHYRAPRSQKARVEGGHPFRVGGCPRWPRGPDWTCGHRAASSGHPGRAVRMLLHSRPMLSAPFLYSWVLLYILLSALFGFHIRPSQTHFGIQAATSASFLVLPVLWQCLAWVWRLCYLANTSRFWISSRDWLPGCG